MTDKLKPLTLALAQLAGRGGVAENAKAMEKAALAAVANGSAAATDLIVFPEGYMTGYYVDSPQQVAVPATQAWDMVGAVATASGVAVAAGYLERGGDGCLHNAAVVVDTHGRVLAQYRKRCLYGSWERAHFVAGDKDCVFTFGGWRIGLCICYDIEFPEVARALARKGAELIITPTALMAPDEELVFALLPARAIENNVFVAYANRIGDERELRYVGGSRIVNRNGQLLATAAADETCIYATLNKPAVPPPCDYLADLAHMEAQ